MITLFVLLKKICLGEWHVKLSTLMSFQRFLSSAGLSFLKGQNNKVFLFVIFFTQPTCETFLFSGNEIYEI